jgi:TolA-binding protein
MGEYERSYMVFRATVESRFMTEVRVAGFLQGENEFTKSVNVMGQILAEYPPESYVAAAQYALTQQVYVKAATASADEKLRKAGITRVDLVRQAIDMLTGFLTQFPEDPAADQASFSLASALLELEQYRAVIAACERFMERFPASDLSDSFLYTIGFCHYALGDYDEALATCRRVAQMERTNEQTGRTEESGEKWRAIYILGQINHSLGKAAEAILEYTRVEDRFPDAKQAIEYFTRRSLKLPEVSTLRPNEEKQVQLDFRNVATADLKVYRIDLMKFSLLKRNLENIRSINLAGIRPLHEETIELGDGKDYRDREREIELPIEEEGAYLVVCRGEDLYTSGLVLVSPLVVQVQEDAQSGRVRATVKDAVDEKFLSDVHVKVIGSGNDAFQSGETDLRGVYIADGITGTTTVIAQREDDRYAFHRGEEYLGAPPEKAEQSRAQAAAESKAVDAELAIEAGKKTLLEGIEGRNYDIQQQGQQSLERLYGNSIQGVQVEKAR